VDPNYKFDIEGVSRFCQQFVRGLQEIVDGYLRGFGNALSSSTGTDANRKLQQRGS
jgi:hypothetical protein